MIEVRGKIKQWGNSAAIRLTMSDLRKSRLGLNQEVKVLLVPMTNLFDEVFGLARGRIKKSGQQLKDEIRKELYGM
jgi:uncharacterized protein YdcH (DUF465 family)